MNRIEQVRLAMMIMQYCNSRPETAEETIALIEKIINQLRLDEK